MYCYSKIVVGYHGVTGSINIEPEEYNFNSPTGNREGYTYEIKFSLKYGFSCSRRLFRNTAVLVYEDEDIVTFASFVDPFNPTEEELSLIKFLTKHYTEIDDLIIALCRELLQYVVDGKEEFEMEQLVRQRLKVLEE